MSGGVHMFDNLLNKFYTSKTSLDFAENEIKIFAGNQTRNQKALWRSV